MVIQWMTVCDSDALVFESLNYFSFLAADFPLVSKAWDKSGILRFSAKTLKW